MREQENQSIPQTSTPQPFSIFLENLLRVIVTVVLVVDILLQVVVGVGLLKVLAEGSVSRVSTNWWLHNQKVSDSSR